VKENTAAQGRLSTEGNNSFLSLVLYLGVIAGSTGHDIYLFQKFDRWEALATWH